MIKDGLSSCQAEKELEYLRVENVALRAQLDAEKRRADAAVGLTDKNGKVLHSGDNVKRDKFFIYEIRYGSYNVNPVNCAPAYVIGWYLKIVWAKRGLEESVGKTKPLYDVDGIAASHPAHCADNESGIANFLFEKIEWRGAKGEME